jgi:hypothetical protein
MRVAWELTRGGLKVEMTAVKMRRRRKKKIDCRFNLIK